MQQGMTGNHIFFIAEGITDVYSTINEVTILIC